MCCQEWKQPALDLVSDAPEDKHLFRFCTFGLGRILKRMVDDPTLFPAQLETIPGFSAHKRQRYGQDILRVIRGYCNGQDWRKTFKGATYLETLDYLQAGLSLEEIAQARGMGLETIYGHLAWLIEQGEDVDIRPHLSTDQQTTII